MADCTPATLSITDLLCHGDLVQWSTTFIAAMQAAIDHVIGCVQDFEIPQLDICVSKDDLVDCPLDCDMINFEGVTYGDVGAVCQIPNPPNLGDLQFRYGTGVAQNVNLPWPTRTYAVTFDTPFDSECLFASVMYERAQSCNIGSSGGLDVMLLYAPLIRDLTTTGFVFWPCAGGELGEASDCDVSYRYFAVGQ